MRARDARLAPLAALAALAFVAPSLAITREQVGIVDWHAESLGAATQVLAPPSARRQLFVATEQRAVACLELKTGDVSWRHVLDEADGVDALAWAGGALVSLSGGGRMLRAWAPADGALLWESQVFSGDEAGEDPRRGAVGLLALAADADRDGEPDIAVLAAGGVSVHSAVDGEIIWSADVAAKMRADDARPAVLLQPLAVAGGSDALTVAAVAGVDKASGTASSVEFMRFDLQLGDQESDVSARLPTPIALAGELVVAGKGAAVAAVGADGAKMVVAAVQGKAAKASAYAISDVAALPSASTLAVLAPLGTDAPAGALALELRDARSGARAGGAVLSVSATAAPAKLLAVPAGAAPSAAMAHAKSNRVLGILADASASDVTRLTVFDFADGSEVATADVEGRGSAEHGGAELAALSVYQRKDQTLGYRCVLRSADHSLALLQQGTTVWSREEALGDITSARFVQLPIADDGEGEAVRSLADTWKLQWLTMKTSLRMASRDEYEALMGMRASDPAKSSPFRDHVGMRQLIVVLTSAGKVFGLHSGDGRELWSVYLGTGASGSAALRTVLVWREQVGEADDTELLALGSSGDSTRALWIRASDGEVIAEATLPLAASRALPLEGAAFEGAGGERPVLLASPSGELHLLAVAGGATKDAAAHAEAKEVLAARASKVFFYEADAKAGTVRGFGLVPHADAPAGVRRAQVWQLSLPESEALEAVVERVLDPVHTQVRVLGDRSALYKYLGANTAAVFATATEPERASEGAPPSAVVAGLVVYILDTATGRVLYRTVHMGSAGPVQATFRENWVVYHYWSNEAMRNEMSVLELFDDTRDRPSHVQEGLMQLLGAEVTAPEQSSHSLPPLRVLGQSYYMPMSAKAMGATSTAKGVTARQVLLGTGTDQVLALDRRLLDPRRPLKATPASKEERLPPYAEMLPVDPRRMITHRHTVANLRFIESAPTHLESTCLVLAVGLDRYLTRLAPSRSYDTISESFNYLLLSATVVGMVVATLVAARMSARAELKRKWR